MKTNLIFKRQITNEGIVKVVTRIVPVDVPMIDSGEGWILSGHTDSLEVCEGVYTHHVAPPSVEETPATINLEPAMEPKDNKSDENVDVSKFQSDVPGTAKLVRSKGVIKIVARRGKSTYNQTTPNSVCINDFTKNEFFRNCRQKFGNATSLFEFKTCDGMVYDYWNDIIDKEYQRQKKVFSKQGVK